MGRNTFMRCAAVAAACAFAGIARADDTGLACRASFDGLGARPAVTDQCGNISNIFVRGNVAGGKATNAKAFTGFTSTGSCVIFSNVVSKISTWNHDFTCVMWVRNPNMASTTLHTLARGNGHNNMTGEYRDNAWQAWLTTDGRLGLGIQNWGGTATNNLNVATAMPPVLTFETNVWYQVAITHTFKLSGRIRYKHLKGYVTAAGSASIGEAVADLEQNTEAGFGNAYHLVVGGAVQGFYGTSMPAGYFDGEIAGVSLYSRVLTADELLADVQAFAPTYHPIDAVARYHWKLDECGTLPTALDTTTNGINGVTVGSVVGGYAAPTGTCYGGFATTSDKLYADLTGTQIFQNGEKNEILLWVRRPEATSDRTSLLVQSMAITTSPGSSQPWRVSVAENGAVVIAMQSWNGRVCRAVGEPYDWGNGWNLVAVRFDLPKYDQLISGTTKNEDGSVTTNYTAGTANRIRVYAAPASESGGHMRLIAETHIPNYNSRLESSQYVVYGGVAGGYYKEFNPAAVLGPRGRIGETALYVDGWFDDAFRDGLLSAFYAPPKGFTVIFR